MDEITKEEGAALGAENTQSTPVETTKSENAASEATEDRIGAKAIDASIDTSEYQGEPNIQMVTNKGEALATKATKAPKKVKGATVAAGNAPGPAATDASSPGPGEGEETLSPKALDGEKLDKLTFDESGELIATNEKQEKLKEALDGVKKKTGLSNRTVKAIAKELTEEDIINMKKLIASEVVGILRNAEFNPESTLKLKIKHALGVYVINHPGVLFDSDKKTVTYEGKTAELVFDENVENFELSV